MDEQAEEIMADLADYYANPEEYTFQDLEDIFQDRDPFEFLQRGEQEGITPLHPGRPITLDPIYDCKIFSPNT